MSFESLEDNIVKNIKKGIKDNLTDIAIIKMIIYKYGLHNLSRSSLELIERLRNENN